MKAIKGTVYLTGAGPGDIGLITIKGQHLLQSADVVVYDYLANSELLKHCQPSCKKIYVGKKAGNHTLQQEDINQLLVDHAKQNLSVVRLKGGDPYVFGRGSEEALYLCENNIPFEVIPGVTSGVAAAAYAGIPLTHRDLTTSVTFVTGHESADKTENTINWKALSNLGGTLVFYMGVGNLENICHKLKQHGMLPETPVVLVRYGTWPTQQTVVGNLNTIVDEVAKQKLNPPALIVIGNVVAFHNDLNWFEKQPLFGKRILVTRSRVQASALSERLSQLGAQVVELAVIEITPTKNPKPLIKAIHQLNTFQHILFTSVNGVNGFFDQLKSLGYDARQLASCQLTTIGSETANALNQYGLKSDYTPLSYTSESIVNTFNTYNISLEASKILIPTSNLATDHLKQALEAKGAIVTKIEAYHNQMPTYRTDEFEEIFFQPFDLITFTSSSTVDNLTKLLSKHNLAHHIPEFKAVSIGPQTSQTALDYKYNIVAESNPHTIEQLSETILHYLKKQ